MSLNTQLRIFLLIIFTIVFTGNFLIGVNESKQFLQSESYSRAHDTSTSLALSLSPLMKDITDPKIASMINIVANRGFFEEIRLESIGVMYSAQKILNLSTDKRFTHGQWELKSVSVDPKYGELTTNLDETNLRSRLASLNQNKEIDHLGTTIEWTRFLPNENFIDETPIQIDFQATPTEINATNQNNGSLVKGTAIIEVSRLLIKDTRESKLEQTPQWFVDLFPIAIDIAKVELSDGWKKIADLSIRSNPADVYHRLFQYVNQAFWYSLAALVITMLILNIFLQRILQPLIGIQVTVEKIGEGIFDNITVIPKTKEFKKVALAINDMAGKLNGYIETLNKEVIRMNEEINIDPLTQLPLKPIFVKDFSQSLMLEQQGYVFIIKIHNLNDIAITHENSEVDEIIKDFSKILVECKEEGLEDSYQVTPYRFFGGEFSLLVVNASNKDVVSITTALTNKLNMLIKKFNLPDMAHIGVGAFKPCSDFTTVLAAANEALESAKQIGPNEAVINQQSGQALDLQQWHHLAEQCVNTGDFNIDYVKPSKKLKGEGNHKQTVMVEAFTRVEDAQGNKVAMATFISIIEKFQLNVAFDQQVINKVITEIEQQTFHHQFLVNLSVDSINNADFIHWLAKKLVDKKTIAPQLVFSITAYAVANQQQAFKQFIDTIHQLGSSVIIKRYDPTLLSLKALQGIKVDAVRLTKEQTLNIAVELPKQRLVQALQELTVLLNIKLYAEDVITEADMHVLKELGVYAASENKAIDLCASRSENLVIEY
jgi:EAL domain-containing protein (putative c-di-GMP-specific phosphodiesterase class I)/GGDEF domain-containing protein